MHIGIIKVIQSQIISVPTLRYLCLIVIVILYNIPTYINSLERLNYCNYYSHKKMCLVQSTCL